MKNKSDKKIILNIPTHIFRARLRLVGLNNGLIGFGKLERIKNDFF
jgi:hypothetical protein